MFSSATGRGRRRRPAYALLTAVALVTPGVAASSAVSSAAPSTTAAPPDVIETDTRTRPVTAGVTAEETETIDDRGWQVTDAVTVDVDEGASVGYLAAGSLTDVAPVTEQAEAAGAVAAVNGDFYDINNSNAPNGAVVRDGELLKSPSGGDGRIVAFDDDSTGRVTGLEFTGSVDLPGDDATLDRLNTSTLPADGIGAYTPAWGAHPRTRAVQNAADVTEVIVADDVVRSVSDAAGTGTLPEGSVALVGRGDGASLLGALEPGDPVTVSWEATTADGEPVHTAIGTGALLVDDGTARPVNDSIYAARTAIGFSADGSEITILSADGDNHSHSRGATLGEMARLMADRGVHTAVEIDGGGSSTMVTREPGTDTLTVDNELSDGGLRSVPNGLGVFAPEADGATAGVRASTALSSATAPGDAPVPGGRPDRVFAGLGRTITARPHDSSFAPATDDPQLSWESTNGTVTGDGTTAVAVPDEPGTATVTAAAGDASDDVTLEVLEAPERVTTTERSVNVASVDDTATFGVIGHDAHGNTAPIEPADVELDYDPALFEVVPDGARGFRVEPVREGVAGRVAVRVGGAETVVAVSVGVQRHVLDTFDDPAAWYAYGTRATAEVAPTPDGEDGAGLQLSYDFTQATATRLGVASLEEPLGVEGRSRSFGLSIRGSGQGEWTAFTFVDGDGNTLPAVYGPYVTWEGWRTVELAVPEGYPDDLAFKRLTIIETKASAQYTGEVAIDNLYVEAAPSVEVPAPSEPQDPVVAQNASAGDEEWTFAVMSDAQFVARNPDSALVRGARRTLREIRAADPDFFVIAGDFVDEASEADFRLARRILDEEIGDSVPYYYVPGNHEVMGADIANFEQHFGETHRVFDHQGTRFVTMNTALGTWNGSGFDQIAMLRQALDSAAEDPAVNSVVVIQHHPPRDPTPSDNSQLADRHEAALLEQWLAEFQHDTGKGVAFVGGHVGLFHAESVDGVPYVINGNAAKTPSTGAADGGFSGWSMFGVDPVTPPEQDEAAAAPHEGGPDWITAELRPHVDELTVSTPDPLPVGATTTLTATVAQGGRSVPVDYPVSSDWDPAPNVYVGEPADAGRRHVAAFDPSTRELTALRPGVATVRVTVNDATETVRVHLTRRER
ncbi:calcineurin-like phosphoesterase family protein [Haloactinopolyspora alba]|uniref:Calcineurin-like phosphoesterase family protein n=1 Tax=Haloactinopolyspora alba TaxID=648780 RepID=A0A2P8EC42_9ACTN|nr:phosphodiester glycosidase family protein [Haloactinopolyspora alba]PSL07010.1 calcineurin-like phosphoesterase family protein [Haloactinopolyspora alba]